MPKYQKVYFCILTIQQVQVYIEDLRLDTERQLICKGSALVRFELLK
jgi:hypothetical protein